MKKLLLALAATAAMAGAQAAATFGPLSALTSFGPGTVAGAGPALVGFLDKFDSSLGTLTGATLTIDGAMDTTITANAVTASRFRTQTDVFMGFDSDIAGLDALLDPNFQFSMSGGPTAIQILGVGASSTLGPFTDTDSVTLDLGGLLAALSAPGGGSFSVSCNALGGMTNSILGGNVDLSQVTTASCGATIAYTFRPNATTVPEPASLALFGLAALGAVAASRRRKA